MHLCAIGQIIAQKKHFHTFFCETTYLGPEAGGRKRANVLRDSFHKLVIYTYNLYTRALFSEIILRTIHHNLLVAIIAGGSKCKLVIIRIWLFVIRSCLTGPPRLALAIRGPAYVIICNLHVLNRDSVVVVVVVILCLIIRGCDLTYAFCIYNSSTRANERQMCLKLKNV